MILDQFLNESSFGYTEDVYGTIEPLEEGYILGEDGNELSMINNEATTELNTIDENIMLIESVALVKELQGANVESLRENAVTDFFKKVKETIKKMAAKVKAFFERLFKSIMIQLRDVNKSLEGVDKYLNKDFNKFKYTAHSWNNNPTIHTTICNNAKKGITDTVTEFQNIEKAAQKIADSNDKQDLTGGTDSMVNDAINGSGYKQLGLSSIIENIIGTPGVETIEAAKDIVRDNFGCKDPVKEFTGNKSDFANMVTFLKGFDKNKVLVDLNKNTKNAYNEALKTINSIESRINAISAKSEANSKAVSLIQTTAKTGATLCTKGLKILNTLMGTCINCNKMRFKEYRSIVASAVRYNPKKSN